MMSDDTDNKDTENPSENQKPQASPWGGMTESTSLGDAPQPTSPLSDTPSYNKGFGVMSSIKDGLGLYAENFATLTALMFLSQLSLYSFTYIQSGTFAATSPTIMQDGVLNYFSTLFVSSAIGSIFSIAALFGALCSINGRQINMSTMLSRAITVFPRAFPAQLLALLLMAIGLIFLIVPGMMVALMFFPLGAVLAWENLSIMASLDRSRALTNGYKWRLFGLILVVAIPIGVLAGIYGVMSGGAIQAATSPSAILLNIILVTLFSGAMNCIVAVVYMQLKNEKE
jgi:uncharacterized membrane protein